MSMFYKNLLIPHFARGKILAVVHFHASSSHSGYVTEDNFGSGNNFASYLSV
ncbi:hypothetical protein APHWI1_1122 [Anaplasma phagocytophilum str. ApWI1]|uniref:Uncharacterized protein n=3 Tax=Anaplasma phagocytophilum TaxID=948 RepID=Q2GLK3_ANAPZ|nr:hypothetical protein APH_0121 [Anaplasma phagocytophilum str. HZ]KJV59710.1 hypothetical protein APHWEB_0392 [Anaplasma phagocytophilum str. Webster]KJV84397.1 hypothetical protein APHWI1_1122 [Anaplasma phagocytophilum str. ApWI1]KJV88429.1 hypothetical protein APHNYW_0076 [Anaplasma phagocytophilum str. ApNYW]KJV99565.1 hypothetical protein OTSANNIE_0301 [Anaplasma phagocytophilum str. Annie]